MALFKKKTEKTKQETPGSQTRKTILQVYPLRIKKPHVTEKTLRMTQQRTYVFIVPETMSKIEAKKQIEKLYSVRCIKVRTTTGVAKTKKWRGKSGTTKGFKKVIVVLDQGQSIELTGQS